MSEGNVVYSSVVFTKSERTSTAGTTSPPAEATYSEVRMVKTQPSKDLPAGPQERAVSNGGSKVTPGRAAIAVLSALLAAAVIALGFISYKNIETTQHLRELAALNKNLTERCSEVQTTISGQNVCPKPPVVETMPCLKCEHGWERHGEKCYHFSTGPLTWTDSRNKCQDLKGDLVKIDSREEQTFLTQKLSEKMNTPEDKFWIGLTDSATESQWLWVDGSPLNESLTFWSGKEPDNWDGQNKDDGEDCVRMGEKAQSVHLNCWFDKSCREHQKYICEKSAENGTLTCR